MNNQLRLGVLIAGLALAVGAGLGLVVPGTEASGPVTTSIYYYAGVDYGTSVLTCGWHSDCEGTPNYERGLDWVSSMSGWNGTAVFNAWGLSSDTSPTSRAHGEIGSDSPFGNCPATSVMIYDQNWVPEVEIYYIHTTPGTHYRGGFPIYAQSLSYNGYFNVDDVGAFLATSTCNFPMHVMTWFAGEVPGTINIIAHDPYNNCTAPGWPSGFYFPCFDPGSNFNPPHDLSDWAYNSSWQTSS